MPFADELISRHTVQNLTHAIRAAAPDTTLTALHAAARQIGPLALRQRADLLRDALLTDLPGDYATLARTVRTARDNAPQFTGWLIWPVTSALATRAVQEGETAPFDDAMALLADLTGRLSSEFAIRTLLRHDVDRALNTIEGDWAGSADPDVRRLASEGTRPYLPWAVRVPQILARPGVTVPILDALYRDESAYVRRSVANHLNDLSRDHPELVVDTARRWLDSPDATTERLVRHGLRTLVKRGHLGALELLGFAPAVLDVDGPRLDRCRPSWRERPAHRLDPQRRCLCGAADDRLHRASPQGQRKPDRQDLQTHHPDPRTGRTDGGDAGAFVPADHDTPLPPRATCNLPPDQRSRVRAVRIRTGSHGHTVTCGTEEAGRSPGPCRRSPATSTSHRSRASPVRRQTASPHRQTRTKSVRICL